jgi:hypothetical protein
MRQPQWGNLMKQSLTLTTPKVYQAFDGCTSPMIANRDNGLEFIASSPPEISLVETNERTTRLRRLAYLGLKPKSNLAIKEVQVEDKHAHSTSFSSFFFGPRTAELVLIVGLMQLIGSLWEYASYHSNDTPIISTVAAVTKQKSLHSIFQLLRIFGPVIYLRNSADDLKCELIDSDRIHDDVGKYARRRNGGTRSRNHRAQEVATFLCCRQTLISATTVGIAALLSVVSAICKLLFLSSDENAPIGWDKMGGVVAMLECASVHMYLLSAIFTLWRGRGRGRGASEASTPWYSNIGSIETLGDAFFGAASIVDVCLQHSNILGGIQIHCWCVVSSLLWTTSSWFYVLAKRMR